MFNRRLYLIVVCLFFLLLSTAIGGADREKQITVIFRYDDYLRFSSTDIAVKLVAAFQQHGFSCTLGVVPYVGSGDYHGPTPQDVVPLTPAKANIIANAIKDGTVEVALHGYSHQRIREKDGYGEFSTLDYTVQLEWILKGKNLLEQMLHTQITTFIPPWNRYDFNTIRAVEKLGFTCFSADLSGDIEKPSSLSFLPETCGLNKVRDAVESARRIPDIQPIIVALFHEYNLLDVDRDRGDITYQELLELLGWLRAQDDVHVRSIEQTTKILADFLNARRFMNNRYLRETHLIPIPPFLHDLYSPAGVYLSQDVSKDNKTKRSLFAWLFYFAILLVSIATAFLVGCIVFPRSDLAVSICNYGIPTLLVVLSVYAFRDLDLQYRDAVVIVVLLGAYIGIRSSIVKLNSQVIRS
jgi:hypothetical protein